MPTGSQDPLGDDGDGFEGCWDDGTDDDHGCGEGGVQVNVSALIVGTIQLVAEVIAKPSDDLAIAKRLLDLFISSGIAPSLLSDYLSDKGKQYAEGAADLAEEAKLGIMAVEAEMKKVP